MRASKSVRWSHAHVTWLAVTLTALHPDELKREVDSFQKMQLGVRTGVPSSAFSESEKSSVTGSVMCRGALKSATRRGSMEMARVMSTERVLVRTVDRRNWYVERQSVALWTGALRSRRTTLSRVVGRDCD
jgi:hypothetical protein